MNPQAIRGTGAPPTKVVPTERRHGGRARRRRRVATAVVAVFCAVPFVVFEATLQDAATDFRVEAVYLITGWGPWVLVVLGSLSFLPVTFSIGRTVYSRWFLKPTIRHAYEAWGVSLYLMGVMLLAQTSQVARAF